jgi:branched-chain amino acid transport system permease protein
MRPIGVGDEPSRPATAAALDGPDPETGSAEVGGVGLAGGGRSVTGPILHRVDRVPYAGGFGVLVVGLLTIFVCHGSFDGLTITIGLGYAVCTVGMVVQVGHAHQLAFSQSVFMALGAYGVTVLETKYGMDTVESFVLALLMALVSSLLIGAVVTRAPGLALALSTLLLPLFLYELASYSGYLGGLNGLSGIRPLVGGAYKSSLIDSGYVEVAILALVVFVCYRIIRSGVGLQLAALAEDPAMAEGLGVVLRWRKLEVFVLGSVLATLGGALVVSNQGIVTPNLVAESAELTILIMVFVPGRKSLIAAIFGAVLIEYLTTSSNTISSNLNTIEGAALILILLVEQDGLIGLARRGYTIGMRRLRPELVPEGWIE